MFRHNELSLILFFLWTFRQTINFKCLIISPEKTNACVRPETNFQLTVALLLGYFIHELIKLVVISRTFIDNTVVSFLIIIPTTLRTKFHFLRSVKSIFSVALFPVIGIFPMSRNNTFETSDFADPRVSFWSCEGVSLSATVFLWKKLLRNMKQMFSIQMQFLIVSRRKSQEFFPTAPFFFVLYMIAYESVLILRKLICPKKFLVTQVGWLLLLISFVLVNIYLYMEQKKYWAIQKLRKNAPALCILFFCFVCLFVCFCAF